MTHSPRTYGAALMAAGILLLCNSCGLLGIVPTPEFNVSGSRVALMPFSGPETWWYDENPTARFVHDRCASLLREAGAQLITSEKIIRELRDYSEDGDPPWIDYGKRLQAEFVVVAHLASWKIDKPTAVGYTPASASMNLQVYSVEENRLALEKYFEVSVGLEDDSTEIFTDSESAKRALLKQLLQKWRIVFIGKPEFS